MDRDLLRELVRLKLNDHRLPQGRAVGFRETAGDGRACGACDAPIDRKERTVLVMVSLEWLSVRFHVDCYKVGTPSGSRYLKRTASSEAVHVDRLITCPPRRPHASR